MQNGFTGVPSAPPIHGCDEEISQATDQISAARSCCTRTIGSNSSTLGKEPSSHVNEGSNIPDQNSRFLI